VISGSSPDPPVQISQGVFDIMINVIPIKIFQGITPKPFREYLNMVLGTLKDKYKRLFIPCVGQFTMPTVAINCGWPAEKVVASDISLYSSILGYEISGKPLEELEIKINDNWLTDHLGQYLEDQNYYASAILYAMKWCQIKEKNQYETYFKRDLENNLLTHLNMIQQTLQSMKAKLKGLRYEIKDIWNVLNESLDDPENIIQIDPPGTPGGYEKMFDFGDKITWNGPAIAEFDAKKGPSKLLEKCLSGNALSLIYRYKKLEPEHQDNAIYLKEYNKERIDYILSNRPELFPKVSTFNQTNIRPSNFKLLPTTHVITPESKIIFIKASKEEALYYRNLFVHKLNATRSQRYIFGILDGYLFAIAGLHMHRFFVKGEEYISETFGVTVPHPKYPRLTKLFMMCLASQAFYENLLNIEPKLNFYQARGIKTVNLTPHPEHKILRGIYKLVKREKYKNNLFKLTYQSDLKPMSYQDCILTWMKKEKVNG